MKSIMGEIGDRKKVMVLCIVVLLSVSWVSVTVSAAIPYKFLKEDKVFETPLYKSRLYQTLYERGFVKKVSFNTSIVEDHYPISITSPTLSASYCSPTSMPGCGWTVNWGLNCYKKPTVGRECSIVTGRSCVVPPMPTSGLKCHILPVPTLKTDPRCHYIVTGRMCVYHVPTSDDSPTSCRPCASTPSPSICLGCEPPTQSSKSCPPTSLPGCGWTWKWGINCTHKPTMDGRSCGPTVYPGCIKPPTFLHKPSVCVVCGTHRACYIATRH